MADEDHPKPSQMQATVVHKQDGSAEAIRSDAIQQEDSFGHLYHSGHKGNVILPPPYSLEFLERLSHENNALGPAVDAMVTNIAGTGWRVQRSTDRSEDRQDANIAFAEDFLAQPWPGESFTSQRKRAARQRYTTGMEFWEVMRDGNDQLAFVRPVETKYVRMVKLDEPVKVPTRVQRGGRTLEYKVWRSERRYAMMRGTKVVYFAEFGATRDLDKDTGEWAKKGQRLPLHKRANQLFMVGDVPDVDTPYYVPRWITQTPSVLGSRKAEEHNLEFFDRGGVPPALIIVQGGTLAQQSREALEQMMKGRSKDKQQAAILETIDTGGSIDQANTVRVNVERFGSERVNDAMFERYIANNEARVRGAFRLPKMFVGNSGDTSFASAFTAYVTAETQVFNPEREEYDETFTLSLIRELVGEGYRLRSLPLKLKDSESQLRALELAMKTGGTTARDVIEQVNEISGLNLEVGADGVVPASAPSASTNTSDTADTSNVDGQGTPDEPPRPSTKSVDDAEACYQLAIDLMAAVRKRDTSHLEELHSRYKKLCEADRGEVSNILASMQFTDPDIDPESASDLAGCTLSVLAQRVASDAQ